MPIVAAHPALQGDQQQLPGPSPAAAVHCFAVTSGLNHHGVFPFRLSRGIRATSLQQVTCHEILEEHQKTGIFQADSSFFLTNPFDLFHFIPIIFGSWNLFTYIVCSCKNLPIAISHIYYILLYGNCAQNLQLRIASVQSHP